MKQDNENKRKITSVVTTIVFHVLIVILLLSIGLPYQDPPPAEMGVEVSEENLTEVEDGFAGTIGGGETTEDPSINDNDDESIVTQNTEKTPLVAKTSKTKVKVKPTEKENKVNEDALFQKGKVKKGGSGSGNGGGNGTSVGSGSGSGNSGDGAGNNGASYSLSGRGAKSLATPKTNMTEIGKVVVSIKVNQEGNVVEAIANAPGTTIMNTNIWKTCEQAAKRSKFSSKPDAPELQKGTITYKFVR